MQCGRAHVRPTDVARTDAGAARCAVDPARTYEIIVADNNTSPELTAAVQRVAEGEGCGFVHAPQRGAGAAWNAGVLASTAPVVVFVDDDMIVGPQFLQSHLERRSGRSRIAVVGPIVPRHRQGGAFHTYLTRRVAINRTPDPDDVDFRHFYGANSSVDRDSLLEVGLFDTDFVRRQDGELAYRLREAGVAFVVAPDARGEHDPSIELLPYLRRCRRDGYYLAMPGAPSPWHRGHREPRPVPGLDADHRRTGGGGARAGRRGALTDHAERALPGASPPPCSRRAAAASGRSNASSPADEGRLAHPVRQRGRFQPLPHDAVPPRPGRGGHRRRGRPAGGLGRPGAAPAAGCGEAGAAAAVDRSERRRRDRDPEGAGHATGALATRPRLARYAWPTPAAGRVGRRRRGLDRTHRRPPDGRGDGAVRRRRRRRQLVDRAVGLERRGPPGGDRADLLHPRRGGAPGTRRRSGAR